MSNATLLVIQGIALLIMGIFWWDARRLHPTRPSSNDTDLYLVRTIAERDATIKALNDLVTRLNTTANLRALEITHLKILLERGTAHD